MVYILTLWFACRLRFEQRLQGGRAAQDALWLARVRCARAVRRHQDIRTRDRHLELVSSPPPTSLYRIYYGTAFSALTLLVGRQEGHPACKTTEWWDAGVVICLERGADLHVAQLMLRPLTVYCFSKIQIGFTFLVPAHLGSPRKRAVKRVCVCVWRC